MDVKAKHVQLFLFILANLALDPQGDQEAGLEPCFFTTDGHFQYCCCDRVTACYHFADWDRCCRAGIYRGCPPDAPVRREVDVRYVGLKHDGQALYSVGDVQTTALQVYNCDHDEEWAGFRRQLARYDAVTLVDLGALDARLVESAARLVRRHNMSAHPRGLTQRALDTYNFLVQLQVNLANGGRLPPVSEIFCVFGYLAAIFVMALARNSNALLNVASLVLSNKYYDISSSTSWPIGYFDLILNLGRRRPKRITTMAAYIRSGGVLTPWAEPLDYTGQLAGDLERRRRRQSGSELRRGMIHATALVQHPALDIEISSFLLRTFPGRLKLTMVGAGRSSYQGGSLVLEHVCSQAQELCIAPHVQMECNTSLALPTTDLVLCSLYTHCEYIQAWAAVRLPLISYYGGYPWNDYSVRAGSRTIADLLRPLHEYLRRGIGSDSGPPALLLVDAPFTAEILQSYTGVQLPVYRPLAGYIRAKYAFSGDKGILLLRASSMSSMARAGIFFQMLSSFAGPDYQPKLHLQSGFLSFEDIAQFRAVLYWPGPHSWVVMQFREMYNMNMPLLVPCQSDLLLHASDFHAKLDNNLAAVPQDRWLPLEQFWKQRHPFSPWLPRDGKTSEYAQVTVYWAQWLEFFQWRHLQVFQGLPHLLELIQAVDFRNVSESMATINKASFARAAAFWRDCLPLLLLT